ncbi:hypothetical protein BDR04DRAFT_1114255 [Suillus decipiens]|nr:hypothetical protein BDR04DRAFT_1114255 [Suillus decipiens]
MTTANVSIDGFAAERLAAACVVNHSSSPSKFLWNSAIVVSIYSGESYGGDFWASFKSTHFRDSADITLAPAFTTYRDPSDAASLVSTFPSIDGFFYLWSCLPILIQTTDLAYRAAVSSLSRPYIMSHRALVTWNYMAISIQKCALGPSPTLHQWFYTCYLAKYYISWFKNGSAPTITMSSGIVHGRRPSIAVPDPCHAMLKDIATITLAMGSKLQHGNPSLLVRV